jgi:hypothetical protein
MNNSGDRLSSPTTSVDRYVYRRSLDRRDLVPAVAVGIATGLAAFYVARLFLERTPLVPAQRLREQQTPDRARG